MKLKKEISSKKERGGYYTPNSLADFIVRLVNDDNISILEPSCGDGSFISSIIKIFDGNNIKKLDAIEIIEEEAIKCEKIIKSIKNAQVLTTDFYLFYQNCKEKYDLIIGNPPYIRYQYLSEKQRKQQAEVLLKNKMTPNKLINSWVFFLVSCIDLLTDSGKIAFVIPAELMQVVYSEDLRAFLASKLNKISIISFEELIFDDVEQEVIVFIGEKIKGKKDCVISNVTYKNIEDLKKFDFKNLNYKKLVDSREKWTKYYLSESQNKIIRKIRQNKNFQLFNDVALINVGITTGNNAYFSISQKILKKYDLEKVSMPLIGRSSQAHGLFFNKQDWEQNVSKNVGAYLLTFDDKKSLDEYSEGQKKYIKLGERQKSNSGYKCRIRNKWYVIPSIWAPNAFFLRRSNNYPKFVLNEINAVSTDTMHRINFYDGVNPRKALLSYYNSITFAFVELNGRSYGGGVLEMLPKEVLSLPLPIIDGISDELVEKLLKIIDDNIRNKKNIEKTLDIIDKEILINHIGLGVDEVLEFRKIWKFMLNRRHSRNRNKYTKLKSVENKSL